MDYIEEIKVYIKVNENNEITEVNSEVFIKDFDQWIYIDKGVGDKYHHAQNHYFNRPIIGDNGDYKYLYINGQVLEKDNAQNNGVGHIENTLTEAGVSIEQDNEELAEETPNDDCGANDGATGA